MRMNINPDAAILSLLALIGVTTTAATIMMNGCSPPDPKFPPASGGRMLVEETQLMETGYRYIIIKDTKTGYEYLAIDHCGVSRLEGSR